MVSVAGAPRLLLMKEAYMYGVNVTKEDDGCLRFSIDGCPHTRLFLNDYGLRRFELESLVAWAYQAGMEAASGATKRKEDVYDL